MLKALMPNGFGSFNFTYPGVLPWLTTASIAASQVFFFQFKLTTCSHVIFLKGIFDKFCNVVKFCRRHCLNQ